MNTIALSASASTSAPKARVTIYTDGSSRGNPGPGGYGAVCVYPNSHGEMHVEELGGREALTTNNRMEIMAAIKSLELMGGFYGPEHGAEIHVHSDSAYMLQGIEKWIHGWKRNNWMTSTKEAVKNEDLWRALDAALETLKREGVKVHWHKVKGHAGHAGNERCDVIATTFADGAPSDLYDGKASGYALAEDILNGSRQSASSPRSHGSSASSSESGSARAKSGSKGKAAYSYVSYVDGVLSVDKTWAECEKRVKGKSAAKFKKSFSVEDESRIKSEMRA